MFDVIDLAKYIITKCMNEKHPISNLQLQKILYYIQEAFLRQMEIVAFDARIEAWQYGPVVPSVYTRFCGYGALPITMKYTIHLDGPTDIVDKVVEERRLTDPWELVSQTHHQGGAWDRVFRNGVGNHQEIPVEWIRNFG